LNCQAVSDVRGRILDFSIGLPGALSDCISFEASNLYERLEGGLLKNGLVLFGNSVYLNMRYMAMPFPNVSSGSKDDYNYFRSQVCIRVECAFGMLVSRWGILRSAIPCNVTIVKTITLVSCLARLHNFCIDQVERSKEHDEDILPLDLEHLMNGEVGYVEMVNVTDSRYNVPIPKGIMDGGNHFDDCPWAARQSRQAEVVGMNELPQTMLLNHVIDSHKTRPYANKQSSNKKR
jgi:hypothetical protein